MIVSLDLLLALLVSLYQGAKWQFSFLADLFSIMDSEDVHALKKEKEKHLVKGNSSGKTCVVFQT